MIRASAAKFLATTLLVGAAFLPSGCSVDSLATVEGGVARNECSSSSDCGDGICRDGQCRAREGQVSALLLSVTPPAEVADIAGVRFLTSVGDLSPKGGNLEVLLGHVSKITGSVTGVAIDTEAACVAAEPDVEAGMAPDGSLSVRVSMVARERYLGLANPVHTAEVRPGEGAEDSYVFGLSVPPGTYDVYVEPLGMEQDCLRPPQLFSAQEIVAGDVNLNLTLPAPKSLDLVVRWPSEDDALEGWTVDVIERGSGRVLSTREKLREPEVTPYGLEYNALIAYSPVVRPEMADVAGSELVRLSPPPGVAAPVVIIERSVVELFQQGVGVIDQLDQLPAPVELTGQVTVTDSPEAVPATVTLVATDLLSIDAGMVAAYQRTVEADENGAFVVDVLPGTYRVVAVPPPESGLSAAEAIWDIGKTPSVQAGKVIELSTSAAVRGRVVDPGARVALPGLSVQAMASPAVTSADVLGQALGHVSFVPRAEGTVSHSDGKFELRSDGGLFDLTVRPETNTGFAWLVRPVVEVGGTGVDLGNIKLPLPVMYEGEITSRDSGTVPAALVRAYAYLRDGELTDDPSEATSVIQIGETRADEDGAFRLLLPASFD